MKLILSIAICSIAFLTIGTSAEAKCGSVFKPQVSIEKNYEGNFEPEFRLGWDIPLGKYCKNYNAKLKAEAEDKAAAARDKAAQHIEQMIQNLDRINKLCGRDWIESICNKQDKLASDIFEATQKLN